MTLVVTTATTRGITVVGDRAERQHLGELGIVRPIRTKVFYSAAANVSFALWGDSTWPPDLGDYSRWFLETIVDVVSKGGSLAEIGQTVCDQVNSIVIEHFDGNFDKHRRGVHVAGYVDGLPHIYHCHTGKKEDPQHELRCHHDYPTLHEPDLRQYAERLADGLPVQLRNGRYDLFTVLSAWVDVLFGELRKRGFRIPAPTLDAQAALDAALVRFASGMMVSAGHAPTVSLEIDAFAFNNQGRATLKNPNEYLGTTMPGVFESQVHSGDQVQTSWPKLTDGDGATP